MIARAMIRGIKKTAFSVFKSVFCHNGIGVIRKGALKGLTFRISDDVDDISIDFIAGRWERDHFDLISRLRNAAIIPKRGAILCDLGANVGAYSAWFDRIYNSDCTIYAFEPMPFCVDRLRDTIQLNKCTSVQIIPKAVTDKQGTMTFFFGNHHSTGSIHPNSQQPKTIVVETISLDDFFFGAEPRSLPHFMKIDIEGGCTHALPGARRLLREAAPLILLDSHSIEEDGAIGAALRELGWSAFRLNTYRWVEDPGKTAPMENGVWGTMLLCSEKNKPLVQKILDDSGIWSH